MSNEIVVRGLGQQVEYARVLSGSDLIPEHYRSKPENILFALAYAEALDIPAVSVMNGIHVIEGKPTAGSNLVAALVRRAGHRIRIVGNDKSATVEIVRADDPDFTFSCTWTIERAKAASLTGKSVWQKYPAAMLKARAVTECAREACSEALFGIYYTAEELGANGTVTEEGEFIPTITTMAAPALLGPIGKEERTAAVARVVAAAPSQQEAAEAWAAAGLPGKPAKGAAVFVSTSQVDELIASFGITDAVIVEKPAQAAPADDKDWVKPTESRFKAMFASLNKAGIKDSDEQHAFIEGAIGRKIESRRGLSSEELEVVVEAAKAYVPEYEGSDPWDDFASETGEAVDAQDALYAEGPVA